MNSQTSTEAMYTATDAPKPRKSVEASVQKPLSMIIIDWGQAGAGKKSRSKLMIACNVFYFQLELTSTNFAVGKVNDSQKL